MPTYVYRNGVLIDRRDLPPVEVRARSDLPAPAVMVLEAYASPINDKTISSHRQREKDLDASGSYDPRDTPASFKRAKDARREANKRAAALTPRYS